MVETEMEEDEPTAEDLVEEEEEKATVPSEAILAQDDNIPTIEKQKVSRGRGRPPKAEAKAIAPANRYMAFEQPEKKGIYDTEKKVVHSENLMEILAEILSKIDKIERSIA